jgi:hypothetical protein
MTDTRPQPGDRDAVFASLTEQERERYLRAGCGDAFDAPGARFGPLRARAEATFAKLERESDDGSVRLDAVIDALLPLLTEAEKRDLVFEQFLLGAEPEDIVAKGFARLLPHAMTLGRMRMQDEAEDMARTAQLVELLRPVMEGHPDMTTEEALRIIQARDDDQPPESAA